MKRKSGFRYADSAASEIVAGAFWSYCPLVNVVRTLRAVHVHNAVWPLPQGGVHVKESYHFSRRPSLRGRGGQDETSNYVFPVQG